MIPNITEVDEVVVGNFYLVPWIKTNSEGYITPNRWVPILGDMHTDEEINVKSPHYHYDLRFFPRWNGDISILNWILNTDIIFPDSLTWRKSKCLRLVEYPGNTIYNLAFSFRPSVPFVTRLENNYEHSISDCKTCPHRGLSLVGVKPNNSGHIRCPGHGLIWNSFDGSLVRKTPK